MAKILTDGIVLILGCGGRSYTSRQNKTHVTFSHRKTQKLIRDLGVSDRGSLYRKLGLYIISIVLLAQMKIMFLIFAGKIIL